MSRSVNVQCTPNLIRILDTALYNASTHSMELSKIKTTAHNFLKGLLLLNELCKSDIALILKNRKTQVNPLTSNWSAVEEEFEEDECMLNFLMDVIRALSVLVCRICIDPMSLSSFINESTPYMQTLFDNTKNTSQNAPTSKNPTHQNQNQNPHIDGKAKTQQPSNPYAYPPPSILNPVHLHLSHPLTPQSIQKFFITVRHLPPSLDSSKSLPYVPFRGTGAPEFPSLVCPDYVWGMEVYRHGVRILDWIVERLAEVRTVGDRRRGVSKTEALGKGKKGKDSFDDEATNKSNSNSNNDNNNSISDSIISLLKSIPPLFKTPLSTPLILKMLTSELPSLLYSFHAALSDSMILLKRLTLVKSEIRSPIRSYLEAVRPVLEGGLFAATTTVTTPGTETTPSQSVTKSSLLETVENALTSKGLDGVQELKDAQADSRKKLEALTNSTSLNGKLLAASFSMEKRVDETEQRLKEMLIPWIEISAAIETNSGRFVIFNKRDFFQKKPSLIQSEYSDLELGRLTVLCRRLKALIPSLGVPGGGSSGGRSDKNKKFQPTQQPLEFNDPAYNSKVLRPFVVSHFNEITMTHKQFVNQLLKILVLLRSGNIDFRVGEYSQTNNRNRNRDVAKFIPGESLRNCVTKFDDAVFVATLDDRRSCLNQQHAILKGGFLGGFVGELKRLEVEGEILDYAVKRQVRELESAKCVWNGMRTEASAKFSIMASSVVSLCKRELDVELKISESYDLENWSETETGLGQVGLFSNIFSISNVH